MATLSLTDPVNGTNADANLIANNNSAIKTVVNGGLQNDNIASGAAIAASKLANYPSDATKYLLGDGTWGSVSATIMLDSITTSGAAITATTEATSVAVISGSTASYTGARVWAEFFLPTWTATGSALATFVFYRDTTVLGQVDAKAVVNAIGNPAVLARVPDTPSAGSHTYKVAAFVSVGSFTAQADAGGPGKLANGYLRIVRD